MEISFTSWYKPEGDKNTKLTDILLVNPCLGNGYAEDPMQ
jgi:hypothetical protein